MLEMRKNMVHYIQWIDLYGPCVVSKPAWNNEANMAACCGSNMFFLSGLCCQSATKHFCWLLWIIILLVGRQSMQTTSKR